MISLPTPLKLIALCLAIGCQAVAADLVVRVRADSWMPFNGEPKSQNEGYVVEILREVFGAKGISVDYALQPWKETLEAVRAGQVDGAIGANETEAVGLLLPQENVGVPRMGIFVRKDIQWEYSNIQSLQKLKLAVISGYSYWDSLDAYIASASKKNLVVLSGDTPLADGLAQLDKGDVDALAETFSVFVWAVKNSGRKIADYRVAFKQQGEPIYVAFAKTDAGKTYASILSAGIKELRANGKLETILKRYGLGDWTK